MSTTSTAATFANLDFANFPVSKKLDFKRKVFGTLMPPIFENMLPLLDLTFFLKCKKGARFAQSLKRDLLDKDDLYGTF